ncbi:MAG: hypothetical protein A2X23_10645 [Chloroflexi bacterium GWC2_73_18]|nr:MAG: hypothetical protein A2X23_10645 [Chloroflexi bacterium GWC2_73_18]
MNGPGTDLPALVALGDAATRDPAVAGRKAANLARLAAAGLPVPSGVVVTAGACARILEACGLGPDPTPEEVAACPIPGDLRDQLERALASFGEAPLAVRSSGMAEDLAGASYAGQYETVLGVRGADAVADALRRCLTSAFSGRVTAYRAATREAGAAPMAVLVQPLVDADVAGVAFGLPEPAVRAIVARADGIPLCAVETIRMLVAEGRLERVDGAYRPVGDLGELAAPETLRSLIASRLDALDPADRSLLQDASVLGQSFTLGGLAAVTGQPEPTLEPRLRGLVRRELLELEADPRSPERGHYAFVQALIREVAYGTLAKRDRRTRHLAVARHLEASGDDEVAGALAEHYLEAHRASAEGAEAEAVAAQARIALRGAAERAAALGAHDPAIAFIEKALGVTSDPSEQAGLLQRGADSAEAAGRYGAAEGYARRAIAVHEATGDRLAAARATARLASVLVSAGQIEPAIAAIEAALATRCRRAPRRRLRRRSRRSSRAPSSGPTRTRARSSPPTARSRSPNGSTSTRSSPKRWSTRRPP